MNPWGTNDPSHQSHHQLYLWLSYFEEDFLTTRSAALVPIMYLRSIRAGSGAAQRVTNQSFFSFSSFSLLLDGQVWAPLWAVCSKMEKKLFRVWFTWWLVVSSLEWEKLLPGSPYFTNIDYPSIMDDISPDDLNVWENRVKWLKTIK